MVILQKYTSHFDKGKILSKTHKYLLHEEEFLKVLHLQV